MGESVLEGVGHGAVSLVRVTEDVLSPQEHLGAVERASTGACVVFTGVVRDHDQERTVTELEYVGHPTARAVLDEVAAEVATDSEVQAVAVSHRLGHLGIGDVALVAAVSAAHRAEAFTACARLVDLVKARLPVWKRQVFADGRDEWVNCP